MKEKTQYLSKVSMVEQTKLGKIKGIVIKVSPKAVLVRLGSNQEVWFPKSHIHSQNDYGLKDKKQEFLISSWVLKKEGLPLDGDFFMQKLITGIRKIHKDNLIALYGIGSYFNDDLPTSWVKNDVDLILVLKSLDPISKDIWERRFGSKKIEKYSVFLAFNTIEMYQNKELFNRITKKGVNYKWAVMNVKYKENSKLLYGDDIRDKLPDTSEIEFNFNDILARALYHLEKSLNEKNKLNAKREFTKAVFKFSYYLCVVFNKNFLFTSINIIISEIERIVKVEKIIKNYTNFLKESVMVRTKGNSKEDFALLREKFITYIFSILTKDGLHKKFSNQELQSFLGRYFKGFPLLKRFLKKM